MMKRLDKIRYNPYISAIALLLWSAGLGAVSLFFARGRYMSDVFFGYFSRPLLLFLNWLPVLLLTALLFFIANRVWIAVGASGVLVLTLTFINYMKLILRNDPLLATDIHYISEAANISGGYNVMLDRHMLLSIAALVIATVFCAVFFRWKLPGWRSRLIGLGIAAVLCAVSYVTLYRSESIYEKTENLREDMSYWSDSDQYVCRGFLYPLLYSFRELSDGRPEGYDRAESEAYYKSLPSGDIPAEEQVSVIAIMLEAYNDFSKFGVLDFTDDPYVGLHALQAESAWGQLVTNIFAGGTIDTERCFVTGATSLVEYRAPADSLARYFSSQGYATSFCHTGYEWFYNRQNVADYLGFDVHYFFENRYFDHNDYGAMNDAHFFPDLITQYEEARAAGQQFFNFSVTYQNHGPYSDSELLYDKTYVSREGLSEGAWYILNNYLAGVAETNAALTDLVDHFRTVDEPVVIVFFGDHNPWMGDGNWVFDEIGVDFSGDEGFYDYYCTPWVIWANDAAREIAGDSYVTGDQGSFSPCFLGAELFDLMGWEGSAPINALRELRQYVDVVHATGAVRENGVLTDTPSPEAEAAVDTYKKLEYYLRKDFLK